jgi:hypothetical protein
MRRIAVALLGICLTAGVVGCKDNTSKPATGTTTTGSAAPATGTAGTAGTAGAPGK